MPGAMHRMGVYLGLVEDEEYADAADGYAHSGGHSSDRSQGRRDDYAEARYSRETHHGRGMDPRDAPPHREMSREMTQRDFDETESYANGGYAEYQPTYQITAVHPRTYNEARNIGEYFRQSTPVIMNLSEMDDADAKRLVDFAAGLTFGLHGRIERVTAKVFLLSPHNVTVTAQDKAKIENGFFNQS
jgi:cell division inhibitor SepF